MRNLWMFLMLVAGISTAFLLGGEPEIIVADANGVKISMLGKRGALQKTLLVFATSREDTFNQSYAYSTLAWMMAEKKWLVVTLDLPCHGEDLRPPEPEGLTGWAYRLKHGEDVVAYHNGRVKKVLDYLIAQRYSNPDFIFVSGTSRGGFLSIHSSIADARIRAAIGFAPVTNLAFLDEFKFEAVPAPVASTMLLKNYAKTISFKPLRMWAGPSDTRVGTTCMVDFAGSLSLNADASLRIMPSVDHNTPAPAYAEAADWLLSFKKTGR